MDGLDLVVVWAICLAVVMGAAIGFWLISRRAPRGVVLMLAIGIYVLGGILGVAADETRVTAGTVGGLKIAGFTGTILGIIDLFHKRNVTTASRAASLNALQATLGAPRRTTKKSD